MPPIAPISCCFSDLLDDVTRDDVADLVRDDAGQFVGLVRLRDETAVDVDVSAGNAERVDARIVDDLERRTAGSPAASRRGCARRCRADTPCALRVIDELHLLRDLRSHLIAELPFLIERDR